MPALNFKSCFVDLVKNGTKRQTIRATRKNPIKVGDTLYLYTGMRTKKCEKIGEAVCKSVSDIEITEDGTILDGDYLAISDCHHLAIADGFEDSHSFREFFKKPFKGQLIKW